MTNMQVENIISDGDFEASNNGQWRYSLTGEFLQSSQEEVVVTNKYAHFFTTESIFQSLPGGFVPGSSGKIRFDMRGHLNTTIGIYDAATDEVIWSQAVNSPEDDSRWYPQSLDFTLGTAVPAALYFRIHADYSQHSDNYLDIDNVVLTLNGS